MALESGWGEAMGTAAGQSGEGPGGVVQWRAVCRVSHCPPHDPFPPPAPERPALGKSVDTLLRIWFDCIKRNVASTSLGVQCLGFWASPAGGMGLIPGRGTKIHMLFAMAKKKKNVMCYLSKNHLCFETSNLPPGMQNQVG